MLSVQTSSSSIQIDATTTREMLEELSTPKGDDLPSKNLVNETIPDEPRRSLSDSASDSPENVKVVDSEFCGEPTQETPLAVDIGDLSIQVASGKAESLLAPKEIAEASATDNDVAHAEFQPDETVSDIAVSLRGAEHEQPPKLKLDQTTLALSSPYSPLETARPLTPPFLDPDEPDSPQSTGPAVLLVPRPDYARISTNLEPPGRRHSTIDLSPTNGPAELLLPLPFPELRRYSLVDAPVSPGIGRRTVSDVGQITSTLPSRGDFLTRDDASTTESQSSSRPASRPSTARYSTFAEMGVQSFAMAKGEKTIETAKKAGKGNRKNRDKEKKPRKSKSVSALGNMGDAPPEVDHGPITRDETQADPAPTALTPESSDVPPAQQEKPLLKRRDPKGKSSNCIIM